MPTDVISKIGVTNSPTTMDYSTLQSWDDACPANLVTDDKRWIGECYDQGEFVTSGPGLYIGGNTTDATRYIILRCASGAGFAEKAAVRTTPLTYDSTKGVAVRKTANYDYCCSINASYTQVIGLQFNNTGSLSTGIGGGGGGGVTDLCIDSCIVKAKAGAVIGVYGTGSKVLNSIAILDSTANTSGIYNAGSGGIHGCTSVRLSGTTGNGFAVGAYSNCQIKNCASFGYTAFHTGNAASGSGYNATDLGSAAGSNNQTSLTFADQFENSANDFRAKSTGSLDLNGTPDATNLATDISRTTRHATTPTIGCWEVVVGGSDVSADVVVGLWVFAGVAATVNRTADVPAGPATFTGVAATADRTALVPPGPAVFAGVAATADYAPAVPAGTITFAGVAATAQIEALATVGTITFVGNGPQSEGDASVPAGTITFAGTTPTGDRTVAAPAGAIAFGQTAQDEIQEVSFGGGTSGILFLDFMGTPIATDISNPLGTWQTLFSSFGTVASISGGLRFTFDNFSYTNTNVPEMTITLDATNGTASVTTTRHGSTGYSVTAEIGALVAAGTITLAGNSGVVATEAVVVVGALAFAGQGPTAAFAGTAPVGAVVFAGVAPVVAYTASVAVGAVVFAGVIPTITVPDELRTLIITSVVVVSAIGATVTVEPYLRGSASVEP